MNKRRKRWVNVLALAFLPILQVVGQAVPERSESNGWANKNRSIFQSVAEGKFLGTTQGYLETRKGNDTLVLDFINSPTTLQVTHDPEEMYDKSTKLYSTQTTSRKTALSYEVYALANVLSVQLNGSTFSIGLIDGASDTPIDGLSFHYCPEKDLEFLTLYVTKPLVLTTAREVMKQHNVNFPQAQKLAKTITLMSGSTLLFTIRK